MYEILYYKEAVKFLDKNKDMKNKIMEEVKKLTNWPVKNKNIIAKSGNFRGYYRLKIGKT